MTAKPASTVLNIPLTELVPITLNQQLAAAGTPRAAAFAIVHVSSVNVMQPFWARDLASMRERGWRRVRLVSHFEIGMKRREMPRHIRAQIFREPVGRAINLVVVVVLAGN